MAVATWFDAVRESMWFGEYLIAGFKFHPLVLMFAISGSLMISRIRLPKP
jgi:CDP-diacylglycerol--serine O-phosphatidyltransferase